jgi:hypothetical protein
MRWRVRVGYPVAVLFWLLANPQPLSILIGGIVAALGLAVRAAASGHLRKDRELATAGPYARTRNPLYLGSAFLAAGFAIAGRSWLAGAIVLIYFAVFYYAVMGNEAEDLHRGFGAEFDAYAARVPLFFPRLGRAKRAGESPAGASGQKFSWMRYRRNREYKALIGTITGLAVVWLRMWLRRRFGY